MNESIHAMIEAEKREVRKENLAVSFEKKEKVPEIKESPPIDLIETGINAAVIHKIQNDEKVQGRMLATADNIIDNRLEEKENDSERTKKESVLLNHKDACDLYGIDEKTVPVWVVWIANAAQNFWYAVWLLVGFVTTAPIVFLSKKIGVVFRRTWIAVLLAIVIYLSAVFVPILIKYLK